MREILVVDDEPTIRHLLQTILESEGFSVATAEDGQAALERLAADPPAVLLLDVRLRGMDGWEVLRRLDALHTGTQVLLLTGDAKTAGMATTAAEHGAAVLEKPFDVDALLDVVGRLADPARG